MIVAIVCVGLLVVVRQFQVVVAFVELVVGVMIKGIFVVVLNAVFDRLVVGVVDGFLVTVVVVVFGFFVVVAL